jgi:hypothetical protein
MAFNFLEPSLARFKPFFAVKTLRSIFNSQGHHVPPSFGVPSWLDS